MASPQRTSASNCTRAFGRAAWRPACDCSPWAPRPTSSTRRKAPPPCTWRRRRGRSCRRSCWWCMEQTREPPTSTAAHPWTTPDKLGRSSWPSGSWSVSTSSPTDWPSTCAADAQITRMAITSSPRWRTGRARPKCPTQSLDLSELAKAAKKKLQALNNRLFEDLAMDVYDEVDRRENDAVWLTTQNHSTLVTERSAVPFLPVNPEYSATRNQGRQKLARFNAREFATLIIDILSDAKRRQQGKGLTSPTADPLQTLSNDDDQHDYDSVASDEESDSELTTQNNNNTQRNNRAKSMDSSDLSDGPITLQEYLEVKKALAASEAKVQQLMKVNSNLSEELRRLQKEISRMQMENSVLRGGQAGRSGVSGGGGGPGLGSGGVRSGGGGGAPSGTVSAGQPHRRDRQAFSMYEPGAAPHKTLSPALDSLAGRLQPLHPSVQKGVSTGPVPFGGLHLSGSTEVGRYTTPKGEKPGSSTDSDYDNTQTYDLSFSVARSSEDDTRGDLEEGGGLEGAEPDPTLPCTEDVILKTEQVTKNIQELLRAAQEFKHDSFVPCSEKIHGAVSEMASLFPKRPALDAVRCSLRLLAASASRLQGECRKAAPTDPAAAPVDYQLLTQQVIQCAYDIAKAAKQLVTITTREKKQ
ncbi:ARF GTPase-activating protein GIT1 isoform X4 [Megalops cyprinoides]|uniref:ARF GTPase-activating protein GIT1 isoform X4 n=1 Tax=Megalops cyprinoides TaxID=118141 RepID=UPI0018643F74|nr:ARF GTPase-activating protein GIT1 isoform X4 [Megalops cyprinoides]